MVNESSAAVEGAVPEPDAAGIAERVLTLCTRQGMTRDGLAARAGMAPTYLRYLLRTGPSFDRSGFVRLAAALSTGYDDLVAGRSDAPPGQHPAGVHPTLARLTEDECWERLGGHGVGRIALSAEPAPVVLPVNYAVDDRAVVYRTDPHGPAAPPPGTTVSFEVDRVDEEMRNGWSVLLAGTADRIEDADAVRRLEETHRMGPWPGAGRPLWMRVTPARLTGRRILTK